MTNPYGPWATLINAGPNPQLSAFWKRRLTMLVPTSRTSSVLSRRSMLALLAVGMLLTVSPTLYAIPAAAEQQDLAQENESPVVTKQAPASESWEVQRAESDPYLGLQDYAPLRSADVRKELGLSSEQNEKLRQIAATSRELWQNVARQMQEEQKHAPAEGQMTKPMEELKADYEKKVKDAAKQIEGLLTSQQLAMLRSRAVQDRAVELWSNATLRDNLGLSDRQKEALARLAKEFQARHWNMEQEEIKNSLALLSSQQRETLARMIPENRGGAVAFLGYQAYQASETEEIRQELDLNPEQRAKLRVITAKYSQMTSNALPKIELWMRSGTVQPPKGKQLTREELKAKAANYRAITDKLGKQMREEIDKVLTPKQLAALEKWDSDRRIYSALYIPHFLKEINATESQRQELRRLFDARNTVTSLERIDHEIGAKAIAVLTAQQREKFRAEVLRNVGVADFSVFMHSWRYVTWSTADLDSPTHAKAAKPAYEAQPPKQEPK